MWRRWRGWISAAVVVVLVVVTALVWPRSTAPTAPTEDVTITAAGGPGEDPTITLDATVYTPATVPAPAMILAHGLGGTKDSVVADAQDLAANGYLVIAYTARGFGASGGHVHLDSLDYEIPDGRAVVDYLATRSDVIQDAPGDPRVGVMGGSYGGGLSLMLAGTDPRVDTAVPLITWNSLPDALFPNFSGDSTGPQDGVFKRYWASILMTSITLGGRGNGGADASALGGVLAGANGATSSDASVAPASPSAGTGYDRGHRDAAPAAGGAGSPDGTGTSGRHRHRERRQRRRRQRADRCVVRSTGHRSVPGLPAGGRDRGALPRARGAAGQLVTGEGDRRHHGTHAAGPGRARHAVRPRPVRRQRRSASRPTAPRCR